jgi:hypothetical protein
LVLGLQLAYFKPILFTFYSLVYLLLYCKFQPFTFVFLPSFFFRPQQLNASFELMLVSLLLFVKRLLQGDLLPKVHQRNFCVELPARLNPIGTCQ